MLDAGQLQQFLKGVPIGRIIIGRFSCNKSCLLYSIIDGVHVKGRKCLQKNKQVNMSLYCINDTNINLLWNVRYVSK